MRVSPARAPGGRAARIARARARNRIMAASFVVTPRAQRSASPGPAKAAIFLHARTDVFHLEEFVDAVMAAFAAQPRLLDPAERCDLGRDDAGIDPDDPVFQRLGHLGDAAEIAGIEIRGEA